MNRVLLLLIALGAVVVAGRARGRRAPATACDPCPLPTSASHVTFIDDPASFA